MRALILGLLVVELLTGPMAANAKPVTFAYRSFEFHSADGASGSYNGFLIIDDSLFDGTADQLITQFEFIGFTMTVVTSAPATFTWGLGNLLPDTGWIFDSSNPTPAIVDVNNYISDTYRLDGFALPGHPEYAGLFFISSAFGDATGKWTLVPEPATLALIAIGIAGLGFARRRSHSRFRAPVLVGGV